PKIIKNRTKKFTQQQSDGYVKIKRNWLKSRGVESSVQRRFKGQILMLQENQAHLPSSVRKFLVHNVKELEGQLMSSKSYCAEIVHNFSPKKHVNTPHNLHVTSGPSLAKALLCVSAFPCLIRTEGNRVPGRLPLSAELPLLKGLLSVGLQKVDEKGGRDRVEQAPRATASPRPRGFILIRNGAPKGTAVVH
ncbi:hypothetical protein U0070_011033, partial [Myodes glareolus]